MTLLAQSASRAVSTVFGLLMVAFAAFGPEGPAVVVVVPAVIAVGLGIAFRPVATLAVLLAVCMIVVSHPSHVLAAWSGLCAAAYLVCRHATGPAAGIVIGSWPTIAGAVGFTFIGLVATSFPLQLPWLPLVAPLAVLAIYLLATRPFLG
jgi:hypothetical protein